ncbi:hypothetical protein PIB30_089077 [Stylosanthes scabra]|uniref:Uncharacterized protein n=1 Tax=Stylosanthes scabra TaxID=79078 RepID=A0ABU6ZSH9_9FABA|nr:hypothetical protein [Stylosanthes scabra]
MLPCGGQSVGVLPALVLGRSRLGGHRHLGQPQTWSGVTGTPNDGTMLARKPRGGQVMGPKRWQRALQTLENLEQHPLPIIGWRAKTKVPRDDILFRGETYGNESALESSAKDSTRRTIGVALQGVPQGSSALWVSPTAHASGGPGPLLLVGKRAAGARIAFSPDSDLEAFSHNPTHGSFAPLAFQPSAMTNCANQRFLSY